MRREKFDESLDVIRPAERGPSLFAQIVDWFCKLVGI
jgi:hypothetical protein